ncbi:ABC transporter ATP-binding protein [Chlorogloea sp. CCALA 695]|uniref:ABC transporter ATP-binding protein n=1 Tax=Chlorogloea sp. CCALA 695 TaxID=2107693 RepID=UPI000D05728E|nr:ABC transporter ATP-binding protein [Chlorogloea sp. CCALA 695]PSB30971.1 ABC transporter ATP-binding protein [Chlorogloea sp. CCALA 695]
MEKILQLDGVSKWFGESQAVADVSLNLPQGILALLGSSGCGKTTLLRLIAGFEQPQMGSIEIAGRKVASNNCWIPPEQRRLGMVFQDYALFPHLTVAENVAFGLKRQDKEAAKRLIELVGLTGLEKRYPYQLSGGQQQRVALARALAPQPPLVLLDEPLSNLDVQVRLRLREEIRDILKATGTSAVFVTHDQEEALAIADLVAVMSKGKLEQIGTPQEVYTQPSSRFVAEFVTGANFIPAERQGQLWATEVGCFAAADAGQKKVELMIREEDLLIEPTESEAVAVVHNRRFLGREYRYCLLTPSGKELHARTAISQVVPVGAKVKLNVASTIKIFPA